MNDEELIPYNDTVRIRRTTSDENHRMMVDQFAKWFAKRFDEMFFDAMVIPAEQTIYGGEYDEKP